MKLIKDYKNLWIWLTIIILITGLISHVYYAFPFGSMLDMQVLMWVRFLVFGVMKLPNISWFADMFAQYDPLAKNIHIYWFIYPFLEIGLWILYLRDMQIHYSLLMNGIVIVITLITSYGIGTHLFNKSKIHCACMGAGATIPLWRPSLIEQAWMCLMAIYMILMMM